MNDEGKLLEKLIPGAVEVDGADSDEFKEETFEAFAAGQIRVLVSKPVIAGFGLIELKEAYFKQAVRNMEESEQHVEQELINL